MTECELTRDLMEKLIFSSNAQNIHGIMWQARYDILGYSLIHYVDSNIKNPIEVLFLRVENTITTKIKLRVK